MLKLSMLSTFYFISCNTNPNPINQPWNYPLVVTTGTGVAEIHSFVFFCTPFIPVTSGRTLFLLIFKCEEDENSL